MFLQLIIHVTTINATSTPHAFLTVTVTNAAAIRATLEMDTIANVRLFINILQNFTNISLIQ